MKIVYLLSLGVVLFFLGACKGRVDQGGKEGLSSEYLIGTWETQSVTVDIPPKGGSGKSSEVSLFPLPDSTKSAKPLTVLAPDGGYREMTIGGSGETSASREGVWHFYQDTLIVRMESQGNVETKFGVRKKGSKLVLTNMVDWTANGKKTEEMRIELKKR